MLLLQKLPRKPFGFASCCMILIRSFLCLLLYSSTIMVCSYLQRTHYPQQHQAHWCSPPLCAWVCVQWLYLALPHCLCWQYCWHLHKAPQKDKVFLLAFHARFGAFQWVINGGCPEWGVLESFNSTHMLILPSHFMMLAPTPPDSRWRLSPPLLYLICFHLQ